jgi:hypothetical protein
MILVGEYIFIFPEPACYKYFIIPNKYHIHPFGRLAGFPARVIVLWQENVRDTRNASLASDRYNVVVDVVNILLYRMKPRKHIVIHVKYCWQTYFKSIGTLSQTFKNHIHNNIVTSIINTIIIPHILITINRLIWLDNG